MEEARAPMGSHKKVHIRKITQMPSVRARWLEKFGRNPTEEDVEKMFELFVPLQLACLDRYTDMIPGAVQTVDELQKKRGLKIGSTTGFTTPMVDILKVKYKTYRHRLLLLPYLNLCIYVCFCCCSGFCC
jgi:phosphonoacetaldehyde hydrolase